MATKPEKQQASFEDQVTKNDDVSVTFFGYLARELSHSYLLKEDEELYSEKQKRVSTFLRTPVELEKMMMFGLSLCLDSFLFIFTFLPIRIFIAVFSMIPRILCCSHRFLDSVQKCDIVRAIILVVCTIAIGYVDISQVYHIVRGQSVIKLYVIYNMLEIFDRLLSSIGQDVLDSLYWVLSGRVSGRGLLPVVCYFICSAIYVFIHSVLILCQVVTVNVAINSHNKALLTVMVSNQFVELKGSVFKKFDPHNLFQMSCSDIRERFHYCILLFIVCVRNLAQFQWNTDHLLTLLPLTSLVLASEVGVDWVKHGFITKFNNIQPSVYRQYTAILARDLASSRHQKASSEHSEMVSRRMGFTPLPLACLLIQSLSQYIVLPGRRGLVTAAVLFLCLVLFKILIGITLLTRASRYRYIPDEEEEVDEQKENEEKKQVKTVGTSSSQPSLAASEKPKQPKSPDIFTDLRKRPAAKHKSLSSMERYTLSGNRIV